MNFILSRLPRANAPHRCLDVCCGTGTLARMLAAHEVNVVGLDRSEEMLAAAQEKIDANPLSGIVELHALDVVDEEWPQGPFDLVVSTFDSLNYLSRAELVRLFAKAHAAVRPGGGLVFDLNTPHKLRDIFADTVYAETHDEYCYVWVNRSCKPERKITFEIDLFLPHGTLYQRFREVHVQHYLEHDEVSLLLKEAGFDVVQAHDDYGDEGPGDASLRWAFYARRSEGKA